MAPHLCSGSRIPRPVALGILLSLFVVSGCRHHRPPPVPALPGPLELDEVRGVRALVVPADEGAVPFARSVARHLSVLPMRVLGPVDVGEAIRDDVDPDPRTWQDRAWERRIPLVLVADPGGEGPGGEGADDPASVALLPADGGDELLRWEARDVGSRAAAVVELRGSIRADFGLDDQRPDGHPTSWMLCSPDDLHQLRLAALLEPGPATLAAVAESAAEFPLDPALIELEAVVRRWCGEDERGLQLLRRAQAFHPLGRSELPLLARMAAEAGMEQRQLELLRWACELWPSRLDLALGLAAVLDESERSEEAADVLLAAAARITALDPEVLELPDDGVERAVALAVVGERADVRYGLGWLLHLTDHPDEALAAYALSRQLYDAVRERDNAATCANNSGVILIEQGRPLAAIPPLRRALHDRSSGGVTLEASNTLYNLGAAYQEVGRLDDAEAALRRAADGFRDAGALDDQYDTLLEVVVLTGEQGSLDGVEQAYQDALTAAADQPDTEESRARALDAVGVARARVDRFDESLAALAQALDIWIARKDRLHEGQTRYNMAIPHLGRGDMADALAALAEARVIAEELGDTESLLEIDRQMEQIESLK